MPSLIWSCTLVAVLAAIATSTELVPEKFLRPRDFNHHPFTDVGGRPTPKPLVVLDHSNPYAVLSQKKPREGREFARQDVIFYPSPHPSIQPTKKYLKTNEVYDDPYVNIPKNYAFSYIVKDHHSGDDFSHSQAHNGKATRGQYRVKLPDGRIQVVSYTADHKGYRADVQYEDEKPIHSAKPDHLQYQYVPTYPSESSNHISTSLPKNYQNLYAPRPAEVVQYINFVDQYNPSTQATPYATKDQYISTTPRYDDPYQPFNTPTPTPYVHEPYSPSQNYEIHVSPTSAPVLVTPRTLLHPAALTKADHHPPQHVIFKYV